MVRESGNNMMKKLAWCGVWVLAMAAVSVPAEDSVAVFEESFAGGAFGSEPAAPWQSSAGDDGVTVAIGAPPDAAEGERWLHLGDPVSDASRGNANIRRELPDMAYGELRFRLHVDSLARFGVYLGTWPASKPEYRTVGFKVQEDGGVLLVNDLENQRSKWKLKDGHTYVMDLVFEPLDADYTTVRLMVDRGGSEDTLEAVVPVGDPITGLRITTENLDAGGEFYITDLVLTRTGG